MSSIATVKHERVLRILLVFMGVPSVLIGLWAGFAPRPAARSRSEDHDLVPVMRD